MNLYNGEQEIYQSKSGEGWTFGITKRDITNFLQQRGLSLLDHMDSNKLEKRYFQDSDNKIVGKVNGTHCTVYAKIKD